MSTNDPRSAQEHNSNHSHRRDGTMMFVAAFIGAAIIGMVIFAVTNERGIISTNPTQGTTSGQGGSTPPGATPK